MTTKEDLLKRLSKVDEGLENINQQILARHKEGRNPTKGLQDSKVELENQRKKILQELGHYTQTESTMQQTHKAGRLILAISMVAAIVEIVTGITGNSFFGIWSSLFGTPTSVLTTIPTVGATLPFLTSTQFSFDQLTTKLPEMTPTPTSLLIFTESFEDNNLDGWQGSIITPTRGITINAEIIPQGRNNSQGAVQVMHTGPKTFNGIRYAAGLPGEYKAGNSYRASVWCKTEVGTVCHIYFGDGVDNVRIKETQKWCPAGSEWQMCSLCRTLDEDKPVMSMFLYADERAEDVKIYDDVQIEQTESCSQ